jgi:hypothetical protein
MAAVRTFYADRRLRRRMHVKPRHQQQVDDRE